MKPGAARCIAAVALGLFVLGCGAAAPSWTAPSGAPSAAASSPGASTPIPSPIPSIDAQAAVADALARLEQGYSFESVVTVGGETATSAAGRWVDGTSEIEVESGSATVTYRSRPPKTWLREGDAGDWVELAGKTPPSAPLKALQKPTEVVVVGMDGPAVQLVATYPAKQLGLSGTKPVQVSITLDEGGVVRARYESTVGGAPASSETTMSPLADPAPIPAPSVGAG